MEHLAIGMDIGGTNTVYGFTTVQGECLFQNSIRTQEYEHIEDYIQTLCNKIKIDFEKLGDKYKLKGIGIGAPNANYYSGMIENAPNLRWKGKVPLTSLIKEHFNLPVVITNDANAAAIGEMVYGGARNMKDFIVITLGTGLGSGFVANGELIYGRDGFAGELGHVVVNPQGRMCGCGRRGCLESYVSATGIKRTIYKLLADSLEPSLLRGIAFENLSAHTISEAALNGDKIAIEAFDYTGRILGQTLANTVAITNPEAIFIFGGLARAGEQLLKPVREHMEKNMLEIFKGKVKLLPSQLNENAAVLGASALIWKDGAK